MTSSNLPTIRRRASRTWIWATARTAAGIIGLARTFSTQAPPAPVVAARPLPQRASVYVIDDPHGTMRLIGLRGTVDVATVAEVAEALEVTGLMELVHIDFSAAEIAPERAVERLEATFDRVEQRGIRLRVVGLDPEHPALVRRTSR